ncbi:Uncharacterized protein BP5553_08593 [Venustampulla echinocandica]|uniref:DUF7770 domain-containing protein n=1 Tax=Venustampulla echinocandica TaxID=2656787 RepID=A0A370TEN4_9HELO|nr:Uncharacterized protein BP5553_08593 [Venustampulla echinocandica]RDL33154.1 Uncharacterized protein BP5553_08593 [Venustampulla echinocandica]
MPLIYIPKPLANTAPSQVITAIYFCAYAPTGVSGPAESSPSSSAKLTNHWVIYFAISSTHSIRFDPSPTGQNSSLDLIITSKHYAFTENAAKVSHLTPAAGLTVGQVIDHIVNSKYDQYQFSFSGQGCRYWVYSIATLLRSAGYLTSDAEVDAAARTLQVVWTTRGEPVADVQQTGMTQGIFY